MGERLHTTICHVDEASTRDGVPVSVSVTVSWQVQTTQQGKPPVASGWQAIDRLTQAPLRRRVALSSLADLLCDRNAVEHALCQEIGLRASQRGMTVYAVAVREVALPWAIRAKADALVLLALHQCLVRHRLLRDSADGSAPFFANR